MPGSARNTQESVARPDLLGEAVGVPATEQTCSSDMGQASNAIGACARPLCDVEVTSIHDVVVACVTSMSEPCTVKISKAFRVVRLLFLTAAVATTVTACWWGRREPRHEERRERREERREERRDERR